MAACGHLSPVPSGAGGRGAARRCRGDGASRRGAGAARCGRPAGRGAAGGCVCGRAGWTQSPQPRRALGRSRLSEGRRLAPFCGQQGSSEVKVRGVARPRGGSSGASATRGFAELPLAIPRASAWLGADPKVLGGCSPAVRLASARSASLLRVGPAGCGRS